ncbi:MAG: VapC toxin family PIN domain ribonuclease [Sorangiineae bacterium NIC37A_2]|nr:MAG: VapC toxin family PIN domain ribonuclease [Sorangiineae bacterium NIC37A_2]
MIAVDTNILVYAHRRDSEWNAIAYARLVELAESRATWAIPWPCVHEFYSIVTHPRIYSPPSTVAQALDQIEAWMESGNLVLLAEEGPYWPHLREVIQVAKVRGPAVHDARIAAICSVHGVDELWSADRDFSRMNLRVRNPLI